MAEPITEMYCESCGRRHAFDRPKPSRVARLRRVSRGLRSYVLNESPTFGDAMADAWTRLESEGMSRQLAAFRDTFSLCLDCRRYVCHDCWNAEAARCLTCAPTAEVVLVAAAVGAVPAEAGTIGWIATEAPAEIAPMSTVEASTAQVAAIVPPSAAPAPAVAEPTIEPVVAAAPAVSPMAEPPAATPSVAQAAMAPAVAEPTIEPVEAAPAPAVAPAEAARAETVSIPTAESEAASPVEESPAPMVARPPGGQEPAPVPPEPAPAIASTAGSAPMPAPAVPVEEVDADVLAAARAAGLAPDAAPPRMTEAPAVAAVAGLEPDITATEARPAARQRRRPTPIQRTTRGPIRCRECGLHLPAAARYCRRCGVRQAEEA